MSKENSIILTFFLIGAIFTIAALMFPKLLPAMVMWWHVPIVIFGIVIVISLLKGLASAIWGKEIEITCRRCKGSGKVKNAWNDEGIELQCEKCFGTGKEKILVWK